MMKAKSARGGLGGAASRGGAGGGEGIVDDYRALHETEADRVVARDFAAGKFDAMSYAELEEYVEEVRARTGCEPIDDAWDLEMARDAKLGRFDEEEKEARQEQRAGRVFPMLGEFEGGRWDEKIGRDAVAGKFDDMTGEEVREYFAELRSRGDAERNAGSVGKARVASR